MSRTRKAKKTVSLSEVIESNSYLKNLGVKYHNYVTNKTNNQITLNEFVGDLVGIDKRFNNGKGVKRVNKKISKLLDRIINHLIP